MNLVGFEGEGLDDSFPGNGIKEPIGMSELHLLGDPKAIAGAREVTKIGQRRGHSYILSKTRKSEIPSSGVFDIMKVWKKKKK
jgi:hypothetical protein